MEHNVIRRVLKDSFDSINDGMKQSNANNAKERKPFQRFLEKLETVTHKFSLSRNKQKVRSKVAKLSPLDSRADSASSSGSETCVMQSANVGKQHPLATPGAHFGGDRGAKVSKFCHECGSKYPVPNAKFCVECGVRRLD